MTALAPFDFSGQIVRVLTGPDGQPWWVLADVCAVLDLTNPSMVAGRIDDTDALSTAEVIDSMGRTQSARIISESALYEVIFLSRKPDAKIFKRWVTHEVLPTIRKSGRYGGSSFELDIANRDHIGLILQAGHAALVRAEQAEAKVAELAPSASAWDHLASTAHGDYSVNEAAKTLSRDAGIAIGERRLFGHLKEWGWTYRDAAHNWRPYQYQVDAGRLATRARSHHHPRTGELVMDAPQVRVTAKGLGDIHSRLTRGLSVVAS